MSAIRGLGLTTDDQLREIGRTLGIDFNYIGFAEELPSKPPLGFNIINLGDEYMGGSHWTTWYIDPQKKFSIYFDSYAGPPEDKVVQLSPKPLFINNKQVQRYNEEYCGVWALMASSAINRAKDKKNAIQAFVDRFHSVD